MDSLPNALRSAIITFGFMQQVFQENPIWVPGEVTGPGWLDIDCTASKHHAMKALTVQNPCFSNQCSLCKAIISQGKIRVQESNQDCQTK